MTTTSKKRKHTAHKNCNGSTCNLKQKKPTQLGTHQKKLIAFLLKYPGWHSFIPNPTARKAVASLVKRKLIRESCGQVCINAGVYVRELDEMFGIEGADSFLAQLGK